MIAINDLKEGMKFKDLTSLKDIVFTIVLVGINGIDVEWFDDNNLNRHPSYPLNHALDNFNKGIWKLVSHNVKETKEPITYDNPTCTCNRRDLFNYGCRCGAFHKELAMIKKVGNI